MRLLSLAGATLRLSGPALPETVSSTRRSLADWLRENGVGRDPAFDVMVAATEAYTNAVLHAYGMAEGTVDLEAVIEHGTVKVTICDGGTWRHPADGHDGCGLMMMRALMDSVKFETSSKGTHVTMTRERRDLPKMGDLADVVVRRRRDSCVATISGEIDMSNADEIRTVLEDRLVEDASMYVIDLTVPQYLDSAGLRMLFTIAERLRVRGREAAPGRTRRGLGTTPPDDRRVRPVV